MTEQPSLAPLSHTHIPFGVPCGPLSPLRSRGGMLADHVPCEYPCGLGLASPPVAQHLRWVSSEHPDLAPCRLAPASQHLWLVICHDVSQRFTSVDPPTRSSFPTALVLAVVAASHDEATTHKG
jgi:hypothetical protein